jgi:hypothetical protein
MAHTQNQRVRLLFVVGSIFIVVLIYVLTKLDFGLPKPDSNPSYSSDSLRAHKTNISRAIKVHSKDSLAESGKHHYIIVNKSNLSYEHINSIRTPQFTTLNIPLDSLSFSDRESLSKSIISLIKEKRVASSMLPVEDSVPNHDTSNGLLKTISYIITSENVKGGQPNKAFKYDYNEIINSGFISNYINANAVISNSDLFPALNITKNLLEWNAGPTANTGKNMLKISLNSRSLAYIRRSNEDLFAIYDQIPRRVIGEFDFDKVVDIDLLEKSQIAGAPLRLGLPANANPKLLNLALTDFKNLVIFDVFDEPNAHGLKVFDVVKQILRQNNLDYALDKVKSVPVNYFQVQEFGDSIIGAWYRKKAPYNENYKKPVSQEKLLALKGDYRKVPLTYLNALFETFADTTTSVISSSLNVQTADPFIVGALNPYNKVTNFVTASLNDPETFADDYLDKFRNGREKELRFFEPMYSFLTQKQKYGVIIVGDKISTALFGSTQSRNGANIDIMGNGTNWGLQDCTKYISNKDTGTSFATPEIATYLFIAKAVWNKQGLSVDPIEARVRLMLATNLSSPFVDRFSSAGVPDLNKLIECQQGYLVTKLDSIISIDSVISAAIQRNIQYPEERNEYSYNCNKGPGKLRIRGIYITEGKTYVFSTAMGRWINILDPTDLTISISITDKESKQRIEKSILLPEFKLKYKQFVLL